jgi:GT2 family glycosyltransferase
MANKQIRDDVTVLIPSYLRPEQLTACVESIADGEVLPKTVLVVHREDDKDTMQAIETLKTSVDAFLVERASVDVAGHIPPVETGVSHCETEYVALLDDDTEVKPDWLCELMAPFDDPSVGVVGGPAVVPDMQSKTSDPDAGRLRVTGQLGGGLMWCTEGGIRDVDNVPEGNSAWRTDLLQSIDIPPFLREGDSKFYGFYLTLSAREHGYRVLFNPKAFIWHYPGERAPSLDRTDQHRQHWLSSRNYALIALRKMALSRVLAYYLHSFLVGTYGDVGLLRALHMLLTGDDKWRCAVSCGKGRLDALRQYLGRSVGSRSEEKKSHSPSSAQ